MVQAALVMKWEMVKLNRSVDVPIMIRAVILGFDG